MVFYAASFTTMLNSTCGLGKKLCVKRYSENYALNKSSIFSLIMQSG